MNLDQQLTLQQNIGIVGLLAVYLGAGYTYATASKRYIRPLGGSIHLSQFIVAALWPAFLLLLAFYVLVLDPIRDRRR